MVTRGIEQIPAVRGVYIEENTGNHDSLFLEKFFEEGLRGDLIQNNIQVGTVTNQAIVQRRRKLLQVEPDVKSCPRWNVYVEMKIVKPLKHMVTFCFKVLL